MTEPGRILVSGGKGRLGQALARQGCTAFGRDLFDLTRPDRMAALLDARQPACVINCASYTAVDAAEQNEAAARAINAEGAGALASVCSALDIPLIHVSTDMVFDSASPANPLTEEVSPRPGSVYGLTKLEGEALVRAAGGRAVIVRVSWLFGDDTTSFVSKMLSLARTRDTLSIVTDEMGRPTPVDDLAAHLVKLAIVMTRAAPVPPVLHFGPTPAVSRYGWAQRIFDTSASLGGPSPSLKPVGSDAFSFPARRPRGVILDTGLADGLLGPMPDWGPACDKAVSQFLAG